MPRRNTKLDEHKVREIRRRYQQDRRAALDIAEQHSIAALAREFGVSREAVRDAVNGVTWKDVK